MKQALSLTLALVLGFPLTACGGNKNDGRTADGGDVVSKRPGNEPAGTAAARVRLSFNGEEVIVRMHDTPWGNLALFYKDFGYSGGLVVLGSIESGLEKLAVIDGEFTVRIEALE